MICLTTFPSKKTKTKKNKEVSLMTTIVNNDDLNEKNILIYAVKHYDKPSYVTSEFEEDFKRIQYLQKLFYRYEKKHELKERLILNHIIILYNVFGAEAVSRILFLKINKQHWPVLKTFLLYLNIMPNLVKSINGNDIISANIQVDMKVAKILRNI